MAVLLSYLLQILFFSSAALLVGGLAVYFCYRLFCFLVGAGRGRGFLLFWHAFFTPVRELGHLIAAFLFMHHIGGVRFLKLRDPDGELGYVEHSYNRGNPVAVLGNYMFALFPAVLGLMLVFLLLWFCFPGLFAPFWEEVAALGEGWHFAAYVGILRRFFETMLRDFAAAPLRKAVGVLLILLLSLGVHISLDDLRHALSGFVVFGVCSAVLALLMTLFDPRLSRMMAVGLQGFFFATVALYLIVLSAALAAVAIGVLFFLWRGIAALGNRGRLREDWDEDFEEYEDEYEEYDCDDAPETGAEQDGTA